MTSKPLFVELLEPRIAPAILVQGGNLLGGNGNPTTGETSSGGNTVTLVKVLSGSALVFYDSDHGQITSISVGQGTKLDITGTISGDIVTNLDKNGRLTDSDGNPSNGEDGGILLPSTIKGITTHSLTGGDHGSIGRIIAGGDVKNIVTTDPDAQVHGIYAGDGIFRNSSVAQVSTGSVDFNTIESGPQNNFFLYQSGGVFKPAASVKNATLSIGAGLEVFAGSGQSSDSGPGGVGGSITGVHVIKSFASGNTAAAINLFAGDGGNGTTGGDGGSISAFTDDGSTTLVKVQTGHGGEGFNGNGGAGGSFLDSTITTKSPAYSFDIGSGGDGSQHGGAGGSVKGLAFTAGIVTTQQFDASGARSSGTLIATGDFDNDGRTDVVVVNSSNGDAVISLATGQQIPYAVVTQSNGASFVSPQGLTPSDLVTGDFNGDGSLDFAVSYANSNNIGVFYNDGLGHFNGTQIQVATSPYRLVAGDFSGSSSTDLAYLSLPAADATGTNLVSHIYLVENDDAAGFTPKLASTTVVGSASDLVAAPIDADAHSDVFVSLNDAPGSVQTFVASTLTSGAPFNSLSTILTGVPHITNLDATAVGGTLHLLAFSSDVSGGTNVSTDGTPTDLTPALKLFTINTAGQSTTPAANGAAVSGALLASFVGDAADYAVLTRTGVQITSLDGATSKSYTTTDGRVSNFAPLGTDPNDPVVAVGAIPTRFFYSDGSSLTPVTLPIVPQVFSFVGGAGGHGGSLAGGKGGGIKKLTFTETLDGGADDSGGTYTVSVVAGHGGDSDIFTGGAGGDINKLAVTVDPANSTSVDDTTLLSLHAGDGGSGAVGGKGGGINSLTATATFDETSDGAVTLNAFAARLDAGAGGVGLQGRGGDGGTITLSGKASLTGVTFYDANSPLVLQPGLMVNGGAGGVGATSGGDGGAVIAVGSQNAVTAGASLDLNELHSASILAGNGGAGLNGAGGKGGDVLSADVSVQRYAVAVSSTEALLYGGSLQAAGGNGGASTGGIGGNGGSVRTSVLASVQGDPFSNIGVLASGGIGGDGSFGGGAGGDVAKLTLNSPSDPTLFAAALFGGNGGAALESGVGGNGGAVKAVTQTKDVNSSISVILAGAGGAGGGVGGAVKNIKTVGFIGSPNSSDQERLGAFNPSVDSPAIASFFPGGVVPQGIFAGRGDGGNGIVKNITARQISAISAAPDANGLFAPAASVTKINADLIGYDALGGSPDVFDSTVAGGVSPANAVPLDGFILAAAVSDINTVNNARTANFTFIG